jgi:hypothetical protein
VDCGLAHRIEKIAARLAREDAERGRRVGRTKRGEADLGDRQIEGVGDHGKRVHVRRLALVGCHSGGGVSLDVLDRTKAFLGGKLDVLRGDVILKINPRAGLHGIPAMRCGANEATDPDTFGLNHKTLWRGCCCAGRPGGFEASGETILQGTSKLVHAPARADRPLAFGRLFRQISLQALVVYKLAARLRE